MRTVQPLQPVRGSMRTLWTMQSVRIVQSLRVCVWTVRSVCPLQPLRSCMQPLWAL